MEEKKPEQESRYAIRVNGGLDQNEEPFEIALYRHRDEHVRTSLKSVGFSVLKDTEFLTDRYPEQGVEVYLKVIVAQKE